MEIKKYLQYIRFLSIIRSFLRGERTKRDLLIAVGVLIGLRLAIYGVMYLNGAHPMSLLSHI